MVDLFIYFCGIMLAQKCSRIHTLRVEFRGIGGAGCNSNFLNLIPVTPVELLSSEVEFRVSVISSG